MNIESNKERIRNGIIKQDIIIVQQLISGVYKKIQNEMKQLVNQFGGNHKPEDLTDSFITEQLVMYREKLIAQETLEARQTLPVFHEYCFQNLDIIKLIVTDSEHKINSTLRKIALEGLSSDLRILLEEKAGLDKITSDFVAAQYKRFVYDLSHNPQQYFNISEDRFISYVRKNLFECEMVYTQIRSKAEQFTKKRFGHSYLYKGQSDKLEGILQDLVQEAIIDFCIVLGKRSIENPLGLLNRICILKVIDHYNKVVVSDKSLKKDKNSKEDTVDPMGKSSSGMLQDIPMDTISVELSDDSRGISDLDLKDLKTRIENGCRNINHVILMRLYLEGYSYQEIAVTTEYKEDTAKTIVHNIKAKIRKGLGRDFFLDN